MSEITEIKQIVDRLLSAKSDFNGLSIPESVSHKDPRRDIRKFCNLLALRDSHQCFAVTDAYNVLARAIYNYSTTKSKIEEMAKVLFSSIQNSEEQKCQ